MKKWLVLLIILVTIAGLVRAESINPERFRINDMLPVEMTVPDIYDLEDTIVSSLVTIFYNDAEEMPSGEMLGIYVINPKTKKFHYPWCYSALEIGSDRIIIRDTPSGLIKENYKPCGKCNPHVNENK